MFSIKEFWIKRTLAYTSLLRPILEYGAACWNPCRGKINASDRVQKKAAQFTNHTNDSRWETLAAPRTIARLCALFKAYFRNRSWKTIRDRLRGPYCLCRVDNIWEIRDKKKERISESIPL